MKGRSKCQKCEKEFTWYRNKEQGPAKFCSKQCKDTSHSQWCHKTTRNKVWTCCECGKQFEKRIMKDAKHPKYCSKECFGKQPKDWLPKRAFISQTYEQQLVRLKTLFEEAVIRQEGCWNWKYALHKSGYTVMKHGRKQTSGHRTSWMVHNGPIPDRMLVLHKCDNRACTNPDHLFIGTSKDNVEDMHKKGRGRWGKSCLHIEDIETVKEIKTLLTLEVPHSKIARKFGVSVYAISNIKHGKTWKHVEAGE